MTNTALTGATYDVDGVERFDLLVNTRSRMREPPRGNRRRSWPRVPPTAGSANDVLDPTPQSALAALDQAPRWLNSSRSRPKDCGSTSSWSTSGRTRAWSSRTLPYLRAWREVCRSRARRRGRPRRARVRIRTRLRERAPKPLRAGVSGYVLKQSAPAELLQAIRAAAAGGQYLDSSLTAKVRSVFSTSARRPTRRPSGPHNNSSALRRSS